MRGLVFMPAALAVGLGIGCQGAAIDVGEAQPAIIGGEIDSQFVGLCSLEITLPPDPADPSPEPLYCTCSLIAPDVVLTGAHCVFKNVDKDMVEGIKVFFGRSIDYAADTPFGVAEVVMHRYYDDDISGHNDVAVLRLDGTAPVDELPVTLNEAALGQDSVGDMMTLVGYGETANLAKDFGERLKTDVMISVVDVRHLIAGTNTKTSCRGDGGGPGFLDFGDGPVQITINARQNGCQGTTIRTRVDRFVGDFIYPYLDRLTGPCTVDGNCETAGCRTPDPDCDPCSWSGSGLPADCEEDCPTRDWDCPLGSFAGEACAANGDCEEGGRCLTAHDDATFLYCSKACDPSEPEPCPSSMLCTDTGEAGNQCVFDDSKPSPGSQGADCEVNSECRSNICEDRICVFECDPGGPACPDPFVCAASSVVDGVNVCRGEEVSGGGGFCAPSVVSGRRGGAGLGGLGGLLVGIGLLVLRRRGRKG